MDGLYNFTCVCPSVFIGQRCEGRVTLQNLTIAFYMARVKNAVRMRVFPASGAYLPLKLYAIDSGREIQKRKLHTQKISLEFHVHKVY